MVSRILLVGCWFFSDEVLVLSVIFGMPAVSCPDPKWCYCQTYGLCNLNCTFKECEGRYTLPRYATIPAGWPEHSRGRDGWP